VDRNRDGKLDYVIHSDPRGLLESGESDDNFDGVFETRMRFQFGNLRTTEVDTDGEGYPDLRSSFEYGILTSMQYVSPSTGLPFRVEHFKLGKMIYAEVDANKDGVLDTKISYTPFGEINLTQVLPK
jgi:hypothetical protein